MTIQGALPAVTTSQFNLEKAPTILSRVTNRVVECAKRFGFGVVAAGVLMPFERSLTFFSQKAGLIQEMGDRFSQVQEGVANLNKLGWELNAEAIASAVCPMEEIVQQMNWMFRYTPELQQTVFSLKAGQFASIGVLIPMLEEFAFRGIIQDVLLKRIPKYVMSKIAPGKETALDSNVAKAARIVLTAAAFSGYHLINKGVFTEAYVSAQLVGTFALGIATGVLKESSAGMLGAIGAHMTNNVIALMPNLLSC